MKKNKKEIGVYPNNVWPTVLLCVLIFYCSMMIFVASIPGDSINNAFIPQYAILLHFTEFFFLALIGYITFSIFEVQRAFSSSVLLIVGMSILTEGIQYFVPGRFFGWVDFNVNLAGGFTTLLILIMFLETSSYAEGPL